MAINTTGTVSPNVNTSAASLLPSYRIIYAQDYPPESQNLITQLSLPVNYGFQALYSLLNKGVTFQNNMAATIQTFSTGVTSTGTPTSQIVITKTVTGTVTGVLVVKVVNTTTPNVYPTGGVFVSYTETSTTLNIVNITGLPVNNTFNITIIAVQ